MHMFICVYHEATVEIELKDFFIFSFQSILIASEQQHQKNLLLYNNIKEKKGVLFVKQIGFFYLVTSLRESE